MKNSALLSPANDTYIYNNYNQTNLKEKKVNKTALQNELGLTVNANIFLVGIVTEMTDSKYSDLLIQIIEAMAILGIQVIVRGRGIKKYQHQLELLIKQYDKQLNFVSDNEEYLHKIYASVDASIILNYNNDNNYHLKNLCNYGVLPISVNCEFLEDYDAIKEQGNAFIIKEMNIWHIFETIIRARENYKFPYDWKNLQLSCMNLFKN